MRTINRQHHDDHTAAGDAAVTVALASGGAKGRVEPHVFQKDEVLDGAYRVGALLGEGGMSEVYEAEDLRLGRQVAIKVSKFGVCQDYLHNEARVLSLFRHPGIVAIHDVRVYHELEYMIIDRIEGPTLRQDMKRRGRGLMIPAALDLILALCDVLSRIHDAGVMHRDLKPSNIMLATDGGIVIIDFGVALRLDQTHEALGVVGSAGYISPEAADGFLHHPVSPLADIYSLGCIAYELLSGRTPFQTGDPQLLIAQHASKAPPYLSEYIKVPRALDNLIAQMMHKLPEVRPQSVDEVSARVRQIGQHYQRWSHDVHHEVDTCFRHLAA